ncbi:MAG TPA: serine/threonine-protein kinase [Polyangia bacterium]|nr:serine/threonine-protein kinase [Polyangia bacterium]
MSCPDEQVILDLTLGALAPDARQRTWAHVERCPQCAGLIGAALPFLGPDPPGTAEDQDEQEQADALPSETEDGKEAARAGADTVPGPQITEPAPRSLQPGQDLRQRYQVVRYVGHGAMGEVYEARHARLVGRYALKILNVDLTHNPMARQRFRREAGIASQLRHPNIVQVIDFDETEGGRPYLVMELLEGRDLGALIAEGPLPLERTLRLTRQIAAGLTAMHAQGIVHRDLKPANVFVLPEGSNEPERIKLVDFGLSKRLVPSLAVTHDRMLLGTPQYMAPEQARGNGDTLGPAADQFAMAAIVYEMLAGRPAFDGELLSVVLYRIVYEPPAPLATLVPGLPPGTAAAIARALAKDPDARFASVSAFWEALAAGGQEGNALLIDRQRSRRRSAHSRIAEGTRWIAFAAGLASAGLGVRWISNHRNPHLAQPPLTTTPPPLTVVERRVLPSPIPDQRPQDAVPQFTEAPDTMANETTRERPRKTGKRRVPTALPATSSAPHSSPQPGESAGVVPTQLPAETPADRGSTAPATDEAGDDGAEDNGATKRKPLVPHL